MNSTYYRCKVTRNPFRCTIEVSLRGIYEEFEFRRKVVVKLASILRQIVLRFSNEKVLSISPFLINMNNFNVVFIL